MEVDAPQTVDRTAAHPGEASESSGQAEVREAMGKMQFWARILAVFGGVYAGAMSLLILPFVVRLLLDDHARSTTAMLHEAAPAIGSLLYLVAPIVGSWLAWRFASAAGAFVRGGATGELATATRALAAWLRYGAVVMFTLLLSYLAIMGMAFFAGSSSSSDRYTRSSTPHPDGPSTGRSPPIDIPP